MEFIDQDRLQYMCHYSFGDHGGVLGKLPQAFMKKANRTNTEFLEACKLPQNKTMALFIDNLRLYKRSVEHCDWEHKKPMSQGDMDWVSQFQDEDLLELCASLPDNKFIIFTALEDIPLDETIKIPDNVVSIYSCNAVYLNNKIKPWPHGLTRMMRNRYNASAELRRQMDIPCNPSRLLYINHRSDTGSRTNLRAMFEDKHWATVSPRRAYPRYLMDIKDHAFVLCPSGNGIDSARNWETLYLGRVPVFKDHPYLRKLFQPFPALFVKDWGEVTEELLKENLHLLEKAKNNESKLDLYQMFTDASGIMYFDDL